MGRVFTYTIFFTMLVIFLQLLGIGTAGPALLDFIGITDGVLAGTAGFDFTSTKIWIAAAALLAITLTGIGISFFTKTSSENYVVVPFIALEMFFFLDVLVGLLGQANTQFAWINTVLFIILLPIGVGYLITMVEFFRGNV